jgi:hypothetical protein
MKRLLRTSIGLALVGATLGCSASTSGGPRSSATPRPDPDFITTAEIESEPFRDAYDIVQRLRPTWFTRKSGSSSARRIGASGGRSDIGAGLLVYLDNARLGGVEALRQLSANAIESLRFVDAATATATLPGIGSSVVSGAIIVRTRGRSAS